MACYPGHFLGRNPIRHTAGVIMAETVDIEFPVYHINVNWRFGFSLTSPITVFVTLLQLDLGLKWFRFTPQA
jgi:hypothetical protein